MSPKKKSRLRLGCALALTTLMLAGCKSGDDDITASVGGGGGGFAGVIDTNFGNNGVASADFFGFLDSARGAVLQTDGKIVVAGSVTDNLAVERIGVARFNVDGSLDTLFGSIGKAITSWEPDGSMAYNVGIQPADGKILVVGSDTDPGDNEGYISRFNSSGTLDASFDGDGTLQFDFSAGTDRAQGVTVQTTDGKIVFVGRENNQQFLVARLNDNGSFDTTFDGDGRISTQIFASTDYANSVAVLNNNSIVVAGLAFDITNSNQLLAVMRHNADGSIDTSFGTSGIALVNFAPPPVTLRDEDRSTGLVVQNDGKVVVATQIGGNFKVVRLNTNGTLDTTFGVGGIATTDLGFFDQARDVIQLSDGSLLAAGDSNNDIAIVKYTPGGTLDLSFGNNGILRLPVGTSVMIYSIIENTDGTLLVGGTIDGDFAVVKIK